MTIKEKAQKTMCLWIGHKWVSKRLNMYEVDHNRPGLECYSTDFVMKTCSRCGAREQVLDPLPEKINAKDFSDGPIRTEHEGRSR